MGLVVTICSLCGTVAGAEAGTCTQCGRPLATVAFAAGLDTGVPLDRDAVAARFQPQARRARARPADVFFPASAPARVQAAPARVQAAKRVLVLALLLVVPVLGAGSALRASRTFAPPAVQALSAAAAQARAAVVAAVGDTPSPPSAAPAEAGAAPAPQVGQPFVVGTWEYTVHPVQRTKTIPGVVGTKEARGEFVLVGVTLRNMGPRPVGVYPWDFSLADATGAEYTATRGMYQFAPDWLHANGYPHGDLADGTGPLPPGGVQTRALVFDAAVEAGGLRLRLRWNGVEVPLE